MISLRLRRRVLCDGSAVVELVTNHKALLLLGRKSLLYGSEDNVLFSQRVEWGFVIFRYFPSTT